MTDRPATARVLLALQAEIEHLRAQRVLDNEDLARAFDMGVEAGVRQERAAAVAHLRWLETHEVDTTYGRAAYDLEHGEHVVAEKKPARAEGFGVRLATADELVEMGLLEFDGEKP
jgi:hypothetical protein